MHGEFSLDGLAQILHEMKAIGDLQANADALSQLRRQVSRRPGDLDAFAESAVNQIIATRMIKRQQMRWNRDMVPSCLSVRLAVVNGTLEQTCRSWHAGFRPLEPAATCAA